METKKHTAFSIRARKPPTGEKIVALTAYDYSFARLIDEWIDIVLVGDSLGTVIHGNANTLSVTLENILYHCKSVARGLRHAHLVADMPFMTYQTGATDALRHAGRLLAEGSAEAVKLEGGMRIAHTVQKLVESGIPVMGHIGLTPQSVQVFGGYRIQGRTEQAQEMLVQDAIALEAAGAYSIVLEGVPSEVAKRITQLVKIPTIGIGAGVHTDGQILVLYDLLGMNETFHPKFLKKYANLSDIVRTAVSQFRKEVMSGDFPSLDHSF